MIKNDNKLDNDMTTKRITIALISLFLMISAFADDKNLGKDITLVSYEQGWMDDNGTLALKNNTSEQIRNLSFLITYLDMSGNPLDYKEYKKEVSIAPGMTKKLDIPPYERERYYHYYKSQNMPGGSPAFKIKFELKDYNIEYIEEPEESYNYGYYSDRSYGKSNKSDGYYMIIAIIAVLFFIGLYVGLYVLVAVMAQHRNRSVVVWILLSLLATPLLMAIILLVVGNNDRYLNQGYDNE